MYAVLSIFHHFPGRRIYKKGINKLRWECGSPSGPKKRKGGRRCRSSKVTNVDLQTKQYCFRFCNNKPKTGNVVLAFTARQLFTNEPQTIS